MLGWHAAEVLGYEKDGWRAVLCWASSGHCTHPHSLSSYLRYIPRRYVSCPSCGRTLFNLQEVTDQIRQRTGHLPGVAIAVMGCIVNGPGEMADADFGYVGGAPGKIDL